MNVNDDGIKDLSFEIVFQAVSDYKKAQKALAKNPNNYQAQKMLNETENFFKSGWFETLTGCTKGEAIFERLQKESVKRKQHTNVKHKKM